MSEETILNEDKTYTDPETGKFAKGNPGGGRPKGSISVVSAIKAKLQECPEGKEKTYLHYLVEKIMKKAVIDDDVSMIKDIIDRVDGKPKQPLTGGGDDDNPIKVSREVKDEDIDKLISIYERNKQNRTAEIDITQ